MNQQEKMSQNRARAKQIGLSANTLTLQHFTPESVDEFLIAVGTQIGKVADSAGPSPWLPEVRRELKGTLTAPSGDDQGAYNFAALTHMHVIRALVGADPSNLRDTGSLMQLAATTDGMPEMKLNLLRIAARWNLAMDLRKSLVLVDEDNAPALQPVEDNQPLPQTTVVNDENGLTIVDDTTSTRIPAGRRDDTTDGDDDKGAQNIDAAAGKDQQDARPDKQEKQSDVQEPFASNEADSVVDLAVPTR